MSLMTDFAKSMHAQAAPIIGKEPVVIGETTIQCVLSESTFQSEFSEGGFETVDALISVCLVSEMPSSSVLKKVARARGKTWRIDSVSKGSVFTTLNLSQVKKA